MKEGKKNDKEQKSRDEEQKIQEEERAMHLKKERKMVFGFETTLSKAKTGRNEVANWLNQSLVEYRVSARLKERETKRRSNFQDQKI